MASLHREPRGKSPFFYAAFSLPDGRRAFSRFRRGVFSQARAGGERERRRWLLPTFNAV